ncbi:MAG: hypothetical protein COZ12_00880, partial [Deltaproteobacteria bacterium CG_4_10_14_3_um_filter_60_8]
MFAIFLAQRMCQFRGPHTTNLAFFTLRFLIFLVEHIRNSSLTGGTINSVGWLVLLLTALFFLLGLLSQGNGSSSRFQVIIVVILFFLMARIDLSRVIIIIIIATRRRRGIIVNPKSIGIWSILQWITRRIVIGTTFVFCGTSCRSIGGCIFGLQELVNL